MDFDTTNVDGVRYARNDGNMKRTFKQYKKHVSGKHEHVLVLGSHEGHGVKYAQKRFPQVIGVDIQEMNYPDFVQANARFLPFRDDSFDVVIDEALLADLKDFQRYVPSHWTTMMKDAIKESDRVLRPGGVFASVAPTVYGVSVLRQLGFTQHPSQVEAESKSWRTNEFYKLFVRGKDRLH